MFLAQNWQLRLLKFETMDLHVSHCLQKQFFSINYMQYNALDEYLIKKKVNKISFILKIQNHFSILFEEKMKKEIS